MNISKHASKVIKETTGDWMFKLSIYLIGILSILLSSGWMMYEIHDRIFDHELIVPETTFVFYICCVIFSAMVILGVQKDRLDYLTPYFITSIILIGYLISIVMITISKWSLVPRPGFTVGLSTVALVIVTVEAILLFYYMERLKERLGIKSTWKRVRGAFTDESEAELLTTTTE